MVTIDPVRKIAKKNERDGRDDNDTKQQEVRAIIVKDVISDFIMVGKRRWTFILTILLTKSLHTGRSDSLGLHNGWKEPLNFCTNNPPTKSLHTGRSDSHEMAVAFIRAKLNECHEHDESNQQDKSHVGSLQERICGVCSDEETRCRWSGRALLQRSL